MPEEAHSMWPSLVRAYDKSGRLCGGTAGFSLIEMVVTVAVLSIVIGITLPNFDSRRVAVLAAQRLVIAQLRIARTNAITKGVHYMMEIPTSSTTQFKIEGMVLNGTIWQVDSTKVQTMTLPTNTQFAAAALNTRVEFNTRGMAVTTTTADGPAHPPATKQVDITDIFNVTKSLQAWPSGQINEL
jgi:prepilin-type N-terminal cleavage/methylation domain-containing protein